MKLFSTISIDTIINAETTQDAISVGGILGTIWQRVKKYFQQMDNVLILTEDATCYTNAIGPIIPLILDRNCGMTKMHFAQRDTVRKGTI